MGTFKNVLAASALTALLALPLSAIAEQTIASSGTIYLRLGTAGYTSISQSFIPQATDIAAVRVALIRRTNPPYPITVSIRTSLTGLDLATSTINPSDVTSIDYHFPSYVTVAFPAPLSVATGTTYYLVLSEPTQYVEHYGVIANVNNPYPNGQFYINTTPYAKYDMVATLYSSSDLIPSPPPPAPTLTFSADPSSLIAGSSTTLSWASTDATDCTASLGWGGTKTLSGTETLTPATTTTYKLTCTGASGSTNKSVTVDVAPNEPPPPTATSTPGTFEGFGTQTTGGTGKPIYHVTNLNNTGVGSIRDALSKGNRYIVFDVGGTITLTTDMYILGPNVTVDGTTAPAPGITLKNAGIIVQGTRGAHDVVIHNIRVRNAHSDGFTISYGAYNVVLDHVSTQFSGDGNIDITQSHDVTVAWSILAEPKEVGDPGALSGSAEKNSLIKYAPWNISLHNNIYTEARQRNPQIRIDDTTTAATTTTTADMRNNIIWDWRGGSGTDVLYGANANIVNNFYGGPTTTDFPDALNVVGGHAYVAGNVVANGLDINGRGTAASSFAAAPVTTADACTGARATLANAGAYPLDSVDQGYLSRISLTSCP